jgi:aspartate carbamoyltransferase catalytic subunit
LINPFYGKDIISIKDFSRSDMEFLFKESDRIKSMSSEDKRKLASGKILGTMFFEPSTRTRLSFEAAMLSIGGGIISITESKTSSIEKGENLNDTIKTVDSYADLIVLRHEMEGAARFAAQIAEKPIINGGSGSEEHPTQAMLDIYTIIKEKNNVERLNIALIGDLKYGRTIYSLLYGLAHFNPRIFLISPPELQIREEAIIDLEKELKLSQHTSLDEVIEELDVIYATRIQKERFPDPIEFEKVKGSYVIDNQTISKGKEDILVMHPLPRTSEIKPEVDSTPNAKYFLQTRYGMIVRAALIKLILTKNN